jgi:hypothetical protein
MNQKSIVKDNSTALQVAGNMSVGLTFENCERLFNLLLQENFPKLEAAAAQKAQENVNNLVSTTYQKLKERLDQIEIAKMVEPDVQSTFNSAVQGAAKKGEKIDINLLSGLLQSRLNKENDDYVDNCIETAVEIIPRLTSELLAVLPIVHLIQGLTCSNEAALDQIFNELDKLYFSQCSNVSINKLKTIASSGAGNYINIMGGDTLNKTFKKSYPSFNTEDAANRFPHVVRVLEQYDKLALYQLSLTTAGQVIATKMLEKIFGEMSIKKCVQ